MPSGKCQIKKYSWLKTLKSQVIIPATTVFFKMYSLGYCIFYSKKGLWSKYILELVGQTTFNTCIFHFTVYSFSCAGVSSHEECVMWSGSQMHLPMGLLCIVRALWETLNCAVILHSFLPLHASLNSL